MRSGNEMTNQSSLLLLKIKSGASYKFSVDGDHQMDSRRGDRSLGQLGSEQSEHSSFVHVQQEDIAT